MKKLNKKGVTDMGGFYNFVVFLILIGLVLGVGVLVLANFEGTDAVAGTSSTVINNTITALSPISATWLPLLVTVVVLAISRKYILSRGNYYGHCYRSL